MPPFRRLVASSKPTPNDSASRSAYGRAARSSSRCRSRNSRSLTVVVEQEWRHHAHPAVVVETVAVVVGICPSGRTETRPGKVAHVTAVAAGKMPSTIATGVPAKAAATPSSPAKAAAAAMAAPAAATAAAKTSTATSRRHHREQARRRRYRRCRWPKRQSASQSYAKRTSSSGSPFRWDERRHPPHLHENTGFSRSRERSVWQLS